MNGKQSLPRRFFLGVTGKPKTVVTLGMLIVVLFAAWIPTLKKDTRADAFIPPDHPALLLRDETKRLFGLDDPLVIAVVNDGQHGVFNRHTLALVKWLTEKVKALPQVDPGRVTSLATENNIIGTEDGMLVERFFDDPPGDQAQAARIGAAVREFPLYLGSLVARIGVGASRIELDENTIRTFDREEPLFIADGELNRLFDGTHYLDILIETPAAPRSPII